VEQQSGHLESPRHGLDIDEVALCLSSGLGLLCDLGQPFWGTHDPGDTPGLTQMKNPGVDGDLGHHRGALIDEDKRVMFIGQVEGSSTEDGGVLNEYSLHDAISQGSEQGVLHGDERVISSYIQEATTARERSSEPALSTGFGEGEHVAWCEHAGHGAHRQLL